VVPLDSSLWIEAEGRPFVMDAAGRIAVD